MTCTAPRMPQYYARRTVSYSTPWPVSRDLQYAVYQTLPRDGFRRGTSASLLLNSVSGLVFSDIEGPKIKVSLCTT